MNKGAKEMFEELGYEWKETNCDICYEKTIWKYWLFKSKTTIFFFKGLEKCSIYDKYGSDIDIKLLQAINKQIEELEW